MERIKANDEDILKCPFCGGEAEMCSGSDRNGKSWYIRCKNCFSRGAEYYESLSALMENEEFFAIQRAWRNAIKAWNRRVKSMSKPTCVGCEHIADFAGNYTECVLLHRFVDWYYWKSLAPDDCPKNKEMEQESE